MRALTRTFSQSGNSRMRKIQRKNSFLNCFDNDFSKPLNSVAPNPPKKKRRLSMLNKTSTSKLELVNFSSIKKTIEKQLNNQATLSDNQNPSTKLISLCQAMKSSEESQTRIHNWDRKMGLRRSHSKTMRNSMRSRKKLLKFCSDQIFIAL